MNKRAMTIAAAVSAGMMFLSSCAGGASDGGDADASLNENGFAEYTGEPQRGGVVNVLGGVDFAGLDPSVAADGNGLNLYNLLYRRLTGYEYDRETGELELVGDLAEDTGTPNADSTEWTYTLKEGLTFEDGTPITAEDIKFGIEHSMDPSLKLGIDYFVSYLKGAEEYEGVFADPAGLDSIKVVDERTITFTTTEPMADFPEIVGAAPGTPFPKDQVTAPDQLLKTPISSGPYKVENYTPGESLTLVRNENWNQETDTIRPAYADGYKFTVNLDGNTIDQRLIAGQGEDANAVAATTNPALPANIAKITQDPQLAARSVQSLPACNYFMIVNTTKGKLGDQKVRQALNWAIDKSSVVNASGGPKLAEVAPNLLLPTVPGYESTDPYATDGSKGDPEKAKQMLAEADAENLELTMDVRSLPMWQAQAEAVQQSLEKVGVTVNLNVIDAAKYYEVLMTPSQQGDLAISGSCTIGWNSGETLLAPGVDGTRIEEMGNGNQSQINDPDLNQAIADARGMSDIDEKNAAYVEIDKQVAELAPLIPLVRPRPLLMVGENVGGAVASPARTGYIDYGLLGLIDPEG